MKSQNDVWVVNFRSNISDFMDILRKMTKPVLRVHEDRHDSEGVQS